MPERSDHERIIAEFLERPSDHRRFRAFFDLTFHMSRAYLRRLSGRGWRLPVQEYSAESDLDDCTMDLLATLYRCDNGRPYYLIFEHFARHPGGAVSDIDLLKALVAGHVHKELDRVKNALDATGHHIKKQIVYALKTGAFEEMSLRGLRCWTRGHDLAARVDGLPMADREVIQEWALAAVREHQNMPRRVGAVFEALDYEQSYANALPLYSLVTAFRAVLCDHSDHHTDAPALPKSVYVRSVLRRMVEQALRESICECLAVQGEKKSLTQVEREAYENGLRAIMRDFVEHGSHDKLPQYLYEQFPDLESKSYLDRHKHVWETLVGDCKERLRDMLRTRGLEP